MALGRPASSRDSRAPSVRGPIARLVRAYLLSRFIPLPSMLQLEISSLCNLRCRMCAKTLGYQGTAPDRVMERETFERIEALLPFLDYVDLSGVWGEAFIVPSLYLEILAKLKSHGIFVRTISNGTLITPEIARRIVGEGLDILSLSVDAARPETYRKIRGGGELEQLLGAVRSIAAEKKRQGKSGPKIEFLVIGMRDTIEELPSVVGMAGSLGVSRVVLQEMAEFESTKGQSVAWHYRQLGKRVAAEAKAIADEVGVEFSLQPCDQFDEPAEKEDFKETRGPRRRRLLKDCFLPWKMAVLTTGGEVIPCCAMFSPMGNVRERSFEDIWRGEKFLRLRRGLLSEDPPPVCVNCQARGWRENDAAMEMREAKALFAFSARTTFRRNPVLKRLKPLFKSIV